MNTRRRMRTKCIMKLFNKKYIVNHTVPYILKCNELSMEFTYTKAANREMRSKNHFGLPSRKEFEKLIRRNNNE